MAAPAWLTVKELRERAPGAGRSAKRASCAYVEETIRKGGKESPWERVEAQLYLGGNAFKVRVQKLLRGRAREQPALRAARRRDFGEVIAVVSEIKGEAWSDYRDRYGDWGRDLALWLGRTHCGLRLRELGELAGGLDYATVSVATKRWQQRITDAPKLAKRTRQAERLLNAKT